MGFWDTLKDVGLGVATGGIYTIGKAAKDAGIMSPGAPPSQDLTGAANAQANASKSAIDAQTAANRPNTTNAYGSSQQWTTGPDGVPRLTQSFGGQMGAVAGGLQSQVAQSFGQPVMTGDAARQQAIDASYGQATSRLDPRFEHSEAALRTRLVNQGLDPQSKAYVHALREFGQNKNDAYTSAMNMAIGQGTAAGDSAFRNNMIARQAPMQDLLSMQGLLGQPDFKAAGSSDPAQLFNAALATNNYNMQDKQMRNQFWSDLIGGAAGAGAKAFGAG